MSIKRLREYGRAGRLGFNWVSKSRRNGFYTWLFCLLKCIRDMRFDIVDGRPRQRLQGCLPGHMKWDGMGWDSIRSDSIGSTSCFTHQDTQLQIQMHRYGYSYRYVYRYRYSVTVACKRFFDGKYANHTARFFSSGNLFHYIFDLYFWLTFLV